MDRESILKEISLWDGVNKYIVKEARRALAKLDAPVKKWSEKELWDLNKAQQSEMLKNAGFQVPNLEKDRVKKLLELMG